MPPDVVGGRLERHCFGEEAHATLRKGSAGVRQACRPQNRGRVQGVRGKGSHHFGAWKAGIPGLIAGANHLRSRPESKATGVSRYANGCEKVTGRGADPTDAVSHLADVTDRMHGLLMERADALMGCVEGSPEETELALLTDIIEAYERKRWPEGRIPGGKG